MFEGSLFPSIAQALLSQGPHPHHAQELMLFGQFVGEWEFDVIYHRPDGSQQKAKGDWHIAWILDGRAIQDVWMVPSAAERAATGAEPVGYGSAIRFYDPQIDAWRVTWHGVIDSVVFRFIARREGEEIVLEGDDPRVRRRWIFSHIEPGSLRWRHVLSKDGGNHWEMQQEMFARRRTPVR
jgi:hypothetical protein